jgi:hypothetical protein
MPEPDESNIILFATRRAPAPGIEALIASLPADDDDDGAILTLDRGHRGAR